MIILRHDSRLFYSFKKIEVHCVNFNASKPIQVPLLWVIADLKYTRATPTTTQWVSTTAGSSAVRTLSTSHSFSFRNFVSRPVLFSPQSLCVCLSLGIYSLECARAPVTDLLLLRYTSSSIIDVAVLDCCLCFYLDTMITNNRHKSLRITKHHLSSEKFISHLVNESLLDEKHSGEILGSTNKYKYWLCMKTNKGEQRIS